MNKSSLQTPKGFRDFLPEAARKRSFLLGKMVAEFAKFGFEPLETPALEYAEILKGKYGEEEKLIYEFEDRGGREVALRYDQTVPLARVMAQYPNLTKPFKRYQIQPVWRAENTQAGRFREFLQVDIDTVGTTSLLADAEVILAAASVLKAIGFEKFTFKINDRSLFTSLPKAIVVALDKLDKIGEVGVVEQIKKQGFNQRAALETLEKIKGAAPTEAINELFDLLEACGLPKENFAFYPTLARGLDYYTGAIIEVEIEGYGSGSVGGGGRYDKLIGIFGKETVPAVGFSFGFDRLLEAAEENGLLPKAGSSTQVLVTIFEAKYLVNSLELVNELRKRGINSEIYLDPNAKLDKQLKYADQKKIPFVAFLGPEEIKEEKITLKDFSTQKQETLTLANLVKKIK
ncbi:MAG: histidine--tRNA ligase [bacterium]|nr:histidine--tRNA ligase [bacterium]